MLTKPKRGAIGLAISYRSFVVAILAYLLIMNIISCFFYVPIALLGRSDFRHLYTAGYMVRSGYAHQLYDNDVEYELQNKLAGSLNINLPFNYLAYEALFFAPLSFVGFKLAYILYFGINLVLVAACFLMLKPYLLSLRRIWAWLPLAIFVCFYPVTVALIQGQDSILMLTLIIAAFVSRRTGHELASGILVGLTLFKFHFSIPFLLLFLAWKWWRTVIGFCAASVTVAGVSLWIAGFAGMGVYLRSLVSMSVGLITAQQQDFYGIHPAGMPNLRGLVSVMAGPYVSHFWVQAITIVCSTLLLFLAARSRPSFSLAVLVSVLVSYHSLIHDTALLVIPLGLLGAASILNRFPYSEWVALLAAVILVSPTVLILMPGYPWVLALPVLALTALLVQITPKGCSLMGMDARDYVTKTY